MHKGACGDGSELGHGFIKIPYRTLVKKHFQLCCKSKPLCAGAGVPDPGREIHDDHLENLGKENYFPQLPREYSGRGDETPLDSWIQDTVYQKTL